MQPLKERFLKGVHPAGLEEKNTSQNRISGQVSTEKISTFFDQINLTWETIFFARYYHLDLPFKIPFCSCHEKSFQNHKVWQCFKNDPKSLILVIFKHLRQKSLFEKTAFFKKRVFWSHYGFIALKHGLTWKFQVFSNFGPNELRSRNSQARKKYKVLHSFRYQVV